MGLPGPQRASDAHAEGNRTASLADVPNGDDDSGALALQLFQKEGPGPARGLPARAQLLTALSGFTCRVRRC